jgi:nicotinamidase-related amidase
VLRDVLGMTGTKFNQSGCAPETAREPATTPPRKPQDITLIMKGKPMSLLSNNALRAIVAALAMALLSPASSAFAQASPSAGSSSVLPTGGGQALLDTSDTVFLLLDHQAGLFQTVKDISVVELRANTTMLAKLASLLKIPVITTASEPNGPNGPLMPEIHQFAPHAVYVPRKGEVNAWDNEDFVKTVRSTGRKTLVMAGVWTSVCVMFPALDAKAAGFKVYAVIDASGDPSELASRTTLARFIQAGVVPTSTNAVLSEAHRTWNRPEAAELAKLYALVAPNYAAVIESYQKAQDVAKQAR